MLHVTAGLMNYHQCPWLKTPVASDAGDLVSTPTDNKTVLDKARG